MNNINKTDFPGNIIKRGIAFVIDAVISFIPVLVIYIIFAHQTNFLPLVFTPCPVVGTVTMYDLPMQVNHQLNTISDSSDDSSFELKHNVSFGATSVRIITILSMAFYVFYSALCTYLYEGKTVGKKLLGLEVVNLNQSKTIKWCLLREVLGKVILNSTIVVPVISIILMLVTPKHYTIHDLISKTMVVED